MDFFGFQKGLKNIKVINIGRQIDIESIYEVPKVKKKAFYFDKEFLILVLDVNKNGQSKGDHS
jgi:hypothetical protein